MKNTQQNIVWHQGQITKIQRQSLLGQTPSTLCIIPTLRVGMQY